MLKLIHGEREPVPILISIAESIMELHVRWCGAPVHPNHNPACKISYERFNNDQPTGPVRHPGQG